MKNVLLLLCCVFGAATQAQTFTNYDTDTVGIQGLLSDITVDEDNTYWVTSWATNNTPGISYFNGTDWQTYGTAEGTSGFNYRGILTASNGNTYFGLFLDNQGPDGFDVFDGTDWTNFSVSDGLLSAQVIDFTEAENGDIWIAVSEGVSRFDGNDFVNYGIDEGLTSAPRSIIVAENDILWLATENGAFSFDGTTFTNYTIDDGLPSNILFAVTENINGDIWLGSSEMNVGVTRFNGVDFTVFPEVTDRVRKIENDSNGNIYIGTWTEGLAIYDGTTFTYLTEDDGLINNNVRGIAENTEGNMVISTWGGVSVYNPTLGVIEFQNSDFKIFPNPAKDYVNVESAGFNMLKYTIFDILGAKITEVQVENGLDAINISALPKGTYLLQFTNAQNQHIVRKLLVD